MPVDSTLRIPQPRSRHPLVRLVRGAWTLPTNLLGHAAGVLASLSLGTPHRHPTASARVYRIRLPLVRAIGGITLGNAILLAPKLLEGELGRAILAHELAHTRQHDVLGPLYLPAHVLAQLASAVAWIVRPVEGSDPVHAHNPLEQRWLFLGHAAALELAERTSHEERDAYLRALGV